MKTKFFISLIVTIIILSYGCKDKSKEEIVAPNIETIEYLSFKDKGCLSSQKEKQILENIHYQSSIKLSKINNAGSNYWDYKNDSLIISTTIMTYCSAELKDSVILTENKIEIYLWDVSGRVVRCSCPIEGEFIFKAESPKTIEVIVYFKSVNSEEFVVVAHYEIKI